MKEFLTAFLGTTYKMPAEKVASLFNEDGTVKDNALQDLLTVDATRIASLKSEGQTMFDNGFKKAQSEVLSLREKEIKEKYGVTTDKKGLDLIDEIVTAKAGQKVEMEPEKVKLHPEYIKLQDDLTNKLKTTETELNQKYKTLEEGYAKEKTFGVISKKADSILAGYGLPEDEKLSNNQKKLLHLQLNEYSFQPNGEDFIVVDKEGKVVNDEYGHRKSFDSLVNEIAGNYWPKLEGERRTGTGATNNAAQNNNQAAKPNDYKGKIKTSQDYVDSMSKAKNAEERMQIDEEAGRAGVEL